MRHAPQFPDDTQPERGLIRSIFSVTCRYGQHLEVNSAHTAGVVAAQINVQAQAVPRMISPLNWDFFVVAFTRHLAFFLLVSFTYALKEERLSALRRVKKLHAITE